MQKVKSKFLRRLLWKLHIAEPYLDDLSYFEGEEYMKKIIYQQSIKNYNECFKEYLKLKSK